MKLIISADDFGRSNGITDNILECVDQGAVSSVSIIANGEGFDHAIKEYLKRPGLRLAIHLNLLEGKPVLPPEEVFLLVDKENEFCYSFFSLWRKYFFSNTKDRQLLSRQVQAEIRAQIKKVQDRMARNHDVNIDSHQHLHLIPFVFSAIVDLRKEFNFSYIRMPREPAIIGDNGWRTVKSYCGINVIKQFVLNILSLRAGAILSKLGIPSCRYFVGILFSGNMSEYVVRAALSRISKRMSEATVEILFHPYRALQEEESIWNRRKDLLKHYRSSQRQSERETLKSASFGRLLKEWGIEHGQ